MDRIRLSLLSVLLLGAQPSADLVLLNGKVITVDAQNRFTTAVAIMGDHIAATGSDAEIRPYIGAETDVIDLHGRTLLPGFIDAHSHVEGLAISENARVPVQIPHAVESTDAILTTLKARATELPPGTWIVGQGTYNQPMPTREELDRALPDHPVVLRWSGHDLLVNHKAVEVANLMDVPDPTGIGRIERTPDGEPAILRDAHVELPLPAPTLDDKRKWIPETLREFFLERGVTSVYDMSTPATYGIYQNLRDANELPVRLLLTYQAKDLDTLIATGIRTGFGDDWLRVGGIKFYMDGVWGTTAATYRPAWRGSGTTWIPNNTGGVRVDQETFNLEVARAHEAGFQVWTHANGDRGADMVLTAYEAAQKAYPRPDARHRIEHFANFLVQDPERTAERLARLKRGGVIPAPQIAFLWRLTDVGVEEPGVKFFPMATLVKEGFRPPGGSDTLGTQNFATNPMFSLSVAVNRKTKHGTYAHHEEALSVMDAIRSHTIWAAFSGFEEDVKGSIEPGKLADLVVLSDDPLTVPPETLIDIHPEMVILGGEIVHRNTPASDTRGSIELFDGRVVPAMPELLPMREQYDLRLEWLADKRELLLDLMRSHGIEMWIVVSEEFHPDPVAQYVAPPLHYTRRRDVMVFVDAGANGLESYSDYWRPTADYARFFESLPAARNARGIQDTRTGLKALWEKYQPETIGLNMGGARGQDSGLTYDTRRFLAEALGPVAESRFVSAAALIEDYIDARLPGELEPYRSLVLATDVIAQRALSNEVITPGVTRASEIKWFFEETIAELGVGGVPWFEIHVAVQRYDPDTGEMIPYVHPAPDDLVFQRGDIIHLDCGFDYLGFASDWQKVAYILREGEEAVPEGLRSALANANVVHEAFASEPRPGMTGWEATHAIAAELEGVDFLPSLYSHPIGHHGHGLGPAINARNMDLSKAPERDSILRPGSYRSIEFSATTAVPEYGDAKVTIPMEDDAYLTDEGYVYFRPYQTEWYVVR